MLNKVDKIKEQEFKNNRHIISFYEISDELNNEDKATFSNRLKYNLGDGSKWYRPKYYYN